MLVSPLPEWNAMSVELIEEVKSYAPEAWVKNGELIKPVQVLLEELFIDSRSGSILKIAKDYMRNLRYFTEFHNTNPEAMVNDLESKRDLPRLEQYRSIRLQLKKFQHNMTEERGVSNNTTIVAISHIKKFFKVNGFDVPFKQRAWEISDYQPLDKAMVIEALENAESLRDKALIHVLWSTGQSAIDIERMNRDDIHEYGKWGFVVRQREKTKRKYVAPLTPECMQALNRYLQRRKDQHLALFVLEPRSKRKAGKKRVIRWKRMTAYHISHSMRRLSERMGLCKKGKKNPLTPAQFRVSFKVYLMLKGLSEELVEYMMGHEQGVRSAYGKYPPQKLMDLVKKHYDALRLTCTTSNNRVDDLEEKISELEATVARLTERVEIMRPVYRKTPHKVKKKKS